MLKVSRILTANSTYGWLLPSGEFKPVPNGEEHHDVARAYFGPEFAVHDSMYGDEYYQLAEQHNWIRLTGCGAQAYSWTSSKLHRLQEFLMSRGVENLSKVFYFEEGPRIGHNTKTIKVTLDEVLTANKASDLLRSKLIRVSKV
jgi:hypothetical protein